MSSPELLDPTDGDLANEINRRFHRYLSYIIQAPHNAGKRLLEVGCARSIWLPYFARQYHLVVSGLDYSEEGCRQAEAVLKMAGVDGHIVCADMFSPPKAMMRSFDYVFSMGVVEHFTDTGACISALSNFLRPDGRIITVIPNMRGTVGALQYLCDSKVYATHMVLTPEELAEAHAAAGLVDIDSRFFLSTNYYVVNTMHKRGSAWYTPRRVMNGLMGRLSMAVWWLERYVGELPTTKSCSPYVICTARKSS